MTHTFEEWLSGLDFQYWATVQHKVSAQVFFEDEAWKDGVILDVRAPEETKLLPIPEAIQVPINELPENLSKIPKDKPVAAFCSSGVRGALAFAYLQLNGFEKVRVLEGGLAGLIPWFMPPTIKKRIEK